MPTSALRLLAEVLDEIGQGHEVVLSSVARELSTQEAADLLNVSRPFPVGLLEQGEIPFHRVGNRRRIRYDDLVEYKQRAKGETDTAFQELVARAHDLDLGY